MSNRKAARAATAQRKWKITDRGGGMIVMHSPDGRRYYGTPGEVRAARLSPDIRLDLAYDLRSAREMYRCGALSKGDAAAEMRRARCEAMLKWFAFNANRPGLRRHSIGGLPIALKLLTDAAARYMGMSPSEHATELAISDIAAIQADARGEGLETFPLTRHERAALSAVGFDADRLRGLADYTCERMLRKYVADVTAVDDGR